MILRQRLKFTFLTTVLLLFLFTVCCSDESENTAIKRLRARANLRSKPKYTELQRPKRVRTSTTTTTTTTTTESPAEVSEVSHDEEDSEEEDEKPRIISNSRGGNDFSVKDSVEKPEEDKTDSDEKSIGGSYYQRPRYTTSTSSPASNGGKKYVEYHRPGAAERAKSRTTTTRAPFNYFIEEEEDESARPNGCNKCRFYCKQCRGAEEVTSGGVWGCCNHNCCGGRCSCQKV